MWNEGINPYSDLRKYNENLIGDNIPPSVSFLSTVHTWSSTRVLLVDINDKFNGYSLILHRNEEKIL